MKQGHLLGGLACAVTCSLLAGCGGIAPGCTGQSQRGSRIGAPARARTRARRPRRAPRRRVRGSPPGGSRSPRRGRRWWTSGRGRCCSPAACSPGTSRPTPSAGSTCHSGRSTHVARLAVPVHDAAGGLLAGAPAVFGGGNSTEQSLVQALHGGAWRRVDAVPDDPERPLGRHDAVRHGRDRRVRRHHGPAHHLRAAGSGTPAARGASRPGVRYAATALVGRRGLRLRWRGERRRDEHGAAGRPTHRPHAGRGDPPPTRSGTRWPCRSAAGCSLMGGHVTTRRAHRPDVVVRPGHGPVHAGRAAAAAGQRCRGSARRHARLAARRRGPRGERPRGRGGPQALISSPRYAARMRSSASSS